MWCGLHQAYADGGYKSIVSYSSRSSEGTAEIKSCTSGNAPTTTTFYVKCEGGSGEAYNWFTIGTYDVTKSTTIN